LLRSERCLPQGLHPRTISPGPPALPLALRRWPPAALCLLYAVRDGRPAFGAGSLAGSLLACWLDRRAASAGVRHPFPCAHGVCPARARHHQLFTWTTDDAVTLSLSRLCVLAVVQAVQPDRYLRIAPLCRRFRCRVCFRRIWWMPQARQPLQHPPPPLAAGARRALAQRPPCRHRPGPGRITRTCRQVRARARARVCSFVCCLSVCLVCLFVLFVCLLVVLRCLFVCFVLLFGVCRLCGCETFGRQYP